MLEATQLTSKFYEMVLDKFLSLRGTNKAFSMSLEYSYTALGIEKSVTFSEKLSMFEKMFSVKLKSCQTFGI